MNKLEITGIKFYYFDTSYKGGRIRAYADVSLNNQITIRGIQIIETKTGGFFPNYPQKKYKGEWMSYLVFENKEFEKTFREKIVDEFKKFSESSNGKAT